jgi:cell division protein DivIC
MRLPFAVPPLLRNFYFVAGSLFVFWMVFLDTNNLRRQFELSRKYVNLREEQRYYQEKIEEVKQDREELFSDPRMLEKFAREKYLMRKPTEDVFVLVPEE